MKAIVVDAVLFDMDGTLIDSTPGVLKAWRTFCKDYSLSEDPAEVAHAAHGRRMTDSLREICAVTETNLEAEIERFEEEVIQGGPVVLPGAIALISQIETEAPRLGWTIVTSATNFYAPRALERCSIPLPKAGIVTSNDVKHGKPNPQPYIAGAVKCGVDPTKCLVIEDAIAGMHSGRAAGSKVIAVCTSTSRKTISESSANPDFIVNDLTKISAKWKDGKIEILIDEGV
ncbi:HAD-like protein [Mycena floridula]|nr:HAD-like protein [Mycena floridula]